MKMKYTAAIALAVWLAVTGWLATMVIAKPAILHLGHDAEETAAMAELRAAIDRNHRAQQRAATLRRVPFVDGGRPLLALPAAPAAAGAGTWQAAQAQAAGYVGVPAPLDVSLVLDTDGRRTAIVDGQRVRVGSRLSDGSRVRAIGTGRVRIQRPDGEVVDRAVQSPYLTKASGVSQ